MGLELLTRETYDDLDGGQESLAGYRSLLRGERPTLHGLRTWAEERDAIVAQLRAWGPATDGSIAVCLPTKDMVAEIVARLDAEAIPAAEIGPDGPKRADGVHVGTMHRFKGLEYQRMILGGVSDGLVPRAAITRYADTDPARHQRERARDRSLLFVAATRARDDLAVFWHGTRSPFITAALANRPPRDPVLRLPKSTSALVKDRPGPQSIVLSSFRPVFLVRRWWCLRDDAGSCCCERHTRGSRTRPAIAARFDPAVAPLDQYGLVPLHDDRAPVPLFQRGAGVVEVGRQDANDHSVRSQAYRRDADAAAQPLLTICPHADLQLGQFRQGEVGVDETDSGSWKCRSDLTIKVRVWPPVHKQRLLLDGHTREVLGEVLAAELLHGCVGMLAAV